MSIPAFQPIFGPPRYHLFIAPAYLILLAHGLARLPRGLPLAAGGRWHCLVTLAAAELSARPKGRLAWPGRVARSSGKEPAGQGTCSSRVPTIVVHPSDPRFPREQVEAARYYLSPRFRGCNSPPASTETGWHETRRYRTGERFLRTSIAWLARARPAKIRAN